MYETFAKSFRSFNFCSYLPYLSPYINFVLEILMYIKGSNSIKQQDVNPILDVSIHRHVWNISKEFKKFQFLFIFAHLSPYINFVLEILMYIKSRHSIKQ